MADQLTTSDVATLAGIKGDVMKLADPFFELRWLEGGAPVSENPTFYHRCNAEAEVRYLERTTGRSVDVVPFSSWAQLAQDWFAR